MHELLEAVSSVYEAVIEPDMWPGALERVAHACDARSAILSFDDGNHGLALNGAFNRLSAAYDAEAAAAYLEEFGAFELAAVERVFEIAAGRPAHAVITDADAFGGLDRLMRHPASQATRRRLGFFRRAACVLNRTEPWRDALLVQYPASLNSFPSGALDRLSMIAPYVARALVSSRPLTLLRARYAMVLGALDRLAVGTAIVTGKGDIVIANRAFERLLDEGTSLLRDRANILRLRSDAGAGHLASRIARAARAAAGDDVDPGETFAVARPDGKPPVMIDVSPLVRVDEISSARGFAIVFAVDPDWRLVTDPRPLATAFGLTEVEQDVCRHLLEGLTNREIADRRNVSGNTVKFHVANVLSKTFARNRTDLAHRAAAADIPLLDED